MRKARREQIFAPAFVLRFRSFYQVNANPAKKKISCKLFRELAVIPTVQIPREYPEKKYLFHVMITTVYTVYTYSIYPFRLSLSDRSRNILPKSETKFVNFLNGSESYSENTRNSFFVFSIKRKLA